MAEVINVVFRLDGVELSARNLDQVRAIIKDLKKELGGTAIGSARFKELNAELTKANTTIKGVTEESRKLAREQTITADKGKGSYRAMQAELTNLKNSYKDLSAVARESIHGKEMRVRIAALDQDLKKIDKTIGQNFRNVGNYQTSFLKLANAFGLTVNIARILGNAVRGAATIVVDFDSAVTNLASRLVKTRGEIAALEKQARSLNSVFTPTEIIKLQDELIKLGFTEQEVLKTTKSILDFSIAAEAEAAPAALVIGAALRAFNLDADQAARVAGVLAVATIDSALDFGHLQTALSKVAPAAAAFNFSIEDSIALLGVLIDAGFDASTAGTSLKNIILNLADSQGALAQRLGGSVKSFDELIPALIKLRGESVDLNEVLELTDQRSVIAFSRFLAGAEDVLKLRDAVDDTSGALADLVEKQLRSLDNQMKLTRAEWQKFILSIEDGEGVFGRAFRNIHGAVQDFLGSLTVLNEGGIKEWNRFTSDIQSGARDTKKELQKLSDALNAVEGGLLQEGFFGGLAPVETDATGKSVVRSIKTIGDEIAAVKKRIDESDPDLGRPLVKRLKELEKELKQAQSKLGLGADKKKEFEAAAGSISDLTTRIGDLRKELAGAPEDEQLIKKLSDQIKSLNAELEKAEELQRRVTEPREIIAQEQFVTGGVGFIDREGQIRSDLEKSADQKIKSEELKREQEQQEELLKIKEEGLREENKLVVKNKEEQRKNQLKAEEELQQELARIINSGYDVLYQGINDIITAHFDNRQRAIDVTASREIKAIEDTFETQIDAARGNTAEQERLQAELEKRRQEINKNAFEQTKQVAIREVLIQGALAAIQALARTGLIFPASLAALGVVAAETALAVAAIKKQEYPGFFHGGFTGKGRGVRDREGRRIAGVTHEDEYVIPAKIVKLPSNRAIIDHLERQRVSSGYAARPARGSYQEGGRVSAMVVELTDGQVDRIADSIFDAALMGTREGSSEGIRVASEVQERINRSLRKRDV